MSNLHVDLGGQNALVIGGGSGGGRAITMALARSGAALAVADLNIERADSVAESIVAAGGRAIALQGDASNRFQCANMIERSRDAFGRVHILVHAATIAHAEPMLQIDEWSWRRQLEFNVTGAFFATQLMARVMADEGGGLILQAVGAGAPESSQSHGIGYAAGMAARLDMIRVAARELAPFGIRVNGVAGLGETVAKAALFLCSEAARHISGQVTGGDSAFAD